MNKKYEWQECQDDELTAKFRELHTELVEKVIHFCKENNLDMWSFNLCADGLTDSIKIDAWCPYTDSAFELWEDEGEHGKPFLMSE